jgi:hypothetical protein
VRRLFSEANVKMNAALGVEAGLLNKERQLFNALETFRVWDFEAQVHVVVVPKLNGLGPGVVH